MDNVLYSTVLYCTVLYSTVLYYTNCSAVCTVLHRTKLWCNAIVSLSLVYQLSEGLPSADFRGCWFAGHPQFALYRTILYSTLVLNSNVLYYNNMYCTVVYYTVLYCIILACWLSPIHPSLFTNNSRIVREYIRHESICWYLGHE